MLPLKIFFSCSGIGIVDRGIETFFREAFDGLRGMEGLEITLHKGAGEERSDERVLWNVPRTGAIASFLGACIRRNSYVAEQLSTFPSMVCAIRKHRPDIIFYSDSNLGFQLFRWRKQIGVPFRLLFSNGGPVNPPFPRADYVHQVAPFYYEQALAAGVPPDQQTMVPYGILVPEGPPEVGAENFTARSVLHEQVAHYYMASDIFTLASLQEGFGRVFLEALIYGMPVIAHNHPVMRFVLGDYCMLADLSKPGGLAAMLALTLRTSNSPETARPRRESVRDRFSWPVLAPQYREMFYDCVKRVQPKLGC